MKRSRAFVLVELLTTILLQAGFILVLCTSFYMLSSFYSKSQQMLTARDHADRVILFFDDKMIHAGLGLWQCTNSDQVRRTLDDIAGNSRLLHDLSLPVAITSATFNNGTNRSNLQPTYAKNGHIIYYGSYVTLLYAERDLSSSNILVTQSPIPLTPPDNTITLLDSTSNFFSERATTALSSWAVTEGVGVPFLINEANLLAQGQSTFARNQIIPAGDELLHLRCIHMFVQGKTTDEGGRQFAFSEPNSNTTFGTRYNQEEGVLEIYMELDTQTNIFTLWVMGTGGYDQTINNPRPANWPENAKPSAANWGRKVNNNEDYTSYPHQIVYVSRASWKLNNIPAGFNWN